MNKTDWKRHANPAVVNAFYSSLENSIQFPAGILQVYIDICDLNTSAFDINIGYFILDLKIWEEQVLQRAGTKRRPSCSSANDCSSHLTRADKDKSFDQ